MAQTNTYPGNGNHHRSAVDVLEDNQESKTPFYDPSNPLLASPKQIDKANQKSRKRKLVILCFVFVVLAGSGFFLYRSLRVERVNVTVQADARRDSQSARNKGDSKNDNNVSNEAIDLARKALGADNANVSNVGTPSPTPSPSLEKSNGSIPEVVPSLAVSMPTGATDNTSTNPKMGLQPGPSASSNQPSNGTTSTNQDLAQSRANITQTLFVDDALPKPDRKPTPTNGSTPQNQNKAGSSSTINITPAVLPPFGTMLPVRTQGVIFTLRNNSYARLELTRDVSGKGWSLSKGTLLIGRTSGSENDRAYVNVIGYIDARDNRLVKMTGEVLGSDGGAGIQGKRVAVDRTRLGQTLRKVASSGMQVAGMMAGALTGRGTVVIDGAGYRLMNPITDEAGRAIGGAQGKQAFVKVEAGRAGYVMVADLPKELRAVDAPGEDELTRASTSLTDREVMELILFATPAEIRAVLPLMTDDQKRLALKALPSEDQKP
jgi:hypothetical protein